jgi:hypothetical protein
VDNLIIGLRAQDFHESLKITSAFGPKDVHYEKTLLVGKAASLAMHLRGLLFIEDEKQLKFAASTLGISSLELPAILHELEEVDFLTVVKAGDRIKRVEIRVPEFRSGYAELGERWTQLGPSEIEQASIETLESLYKGPIPTSELSQSLNLDPTSFAILKDVMSSGQLLSIQAVDGQDVSFTPLAVDGNPNAYLQWAKKFPNEVQAAVQVLQSQQGLHMDDPRIAGQQVFLDAIMTGVLSPVQVQGTTGAKRFVFAPRGGLSDEERVILDKARAILACVRYGQHFASGRRINSPRAILRRLRDKKSFSRGHPDLFDQYGLLVEKLIGEPVRESTNRWNFRVFDHAENMKALDVAIEMLEHGETPSTHIHLDAQKALLSPTAYSGPSPTRVRLSTGIQASSATRSEIIRQMANIARGASAHE